jgi:hypothetical protein
MGQSLKFSKAAETSPWGAGTAMRKIISGCALFLMAYRFAT